MGYGCLSQTVVMVVSTSAGTEGQLMHPGDGEGGWSLADNCCMGNLPVLGFEL